MLVPLQGILANSSNQSQSVHQHSTIPYFAFSKTLYV